MRNFTFFFLSFAFILSACRAKRISDEGFVNVQGGRVWYKIVGADKKKTPLLLLHGGPGHPSYYLKPLEKLSADRPVIFYDQLGCGRSDKPNDTSLWKLSRFVAELETIRKELGLTELHLFGHSCGATVLTEYLTTNPTGIKSIVLASPLISMRAFLDDQEKLRQQLPSSVRDTLLLHERNGTTNSQAYHDATMEYYKRYYCRIVPYPEDIAKTFKYASAQITETMWGNAEFGCTGNLKDFDRASILKDIKGPVLFTCGQYDFATPETTKQYADQVITSEFVVFKNSAHMTMNEEPNAYVKVIQEFLNKHE